MADTGSEGYGGSSSWPLEVTSSATCKVSNDNQKSDRSNRGNPIIPPPSGVLGCGASTTAIPGVKIWPLTISCAVKHLARSAIATVKGNNILGYFIERLRLQEKDGKERNRRDFMKEGVKLADMAATMAISEVVLDREMTSPVSEWYDVPASLRQCISGSGVCLQSIAAKGQTGEVETACVSNRLETSLWLGRSCGSWVKVHVVTRDMLPSLRCDPNFDDSCSHWIRH